MGKYFNRLITSADECTILLYGEIGDTEVNAAEIKQEIMQAESAGKPIEIRINSFGGEVFTGIAIVQAINECKGDIRIFIDGIAASIASVIAMCGKPLEMGRYSRLMIHTVSTGCYGTQKDLIKCVEEMGKIDALLCDIIAHKCHKSSEEIRNLYFDGNDHWFTAEEAFKLGLVDNIFDTSPIQGEPTEENIYTITNRLHGFTPKADYKAFKNKLSAVLSLDKKTDERDILNAINKLQKNNKNVDYSGMIKNALKKGWIDDAEKNVFQSLAKHDSATFIARYEALKKSDDAKIIELICDAERSGRIMPFEREVYKSIGEQMGGRSLEEVLSIKPKPKRVNRFLSLNFEDRAEWTLDDWRIFAPKDLAENPLLYKILMSNKGKKLPQVKTLEWYRKNDPEYLAKHPDIYKELVDNQYNNNKLK